MAKFNFSNFKESLNGLTKRENALPLQTKVWAGVLQNTDLLDCLLSL